MSKINEFFLSPVAQKRATQIVEDFKDRIKAIALVPVEKFNNEPYHMMVPKHKVLVFSVENKTNDEVFQAIKCRNSNNVTMFMTAYGCDCAHEVCTVKFNGDFAIVAGGKKHTMVLSHAKGATGLGNIKIIPFEDKSKGWKQRIASGTTMWPIKGLPTRFRASAECINIDGSTEPLAYWNKELIGLLDLDAEKALRDAKRALEDAKREVEEAECRRRSMEEAFEKAKKYWGYDDPEAVHAAEDTLDRYIEESEDVLYDFGYDIEDKKIIEHFDSEDHIVIEVYAYGVRTKDRYIFTKDGKSLIKIEENA